MIAMDMTTRYAMRYVSRPYRTFLLWEKEDISKLGSQAQYDLLTLGNLYIKLRPTDREKGAMVDNFPGLWSCLDGLCCRRCGRARLSLMWWPKGEHN
jgi:hypothetical protein